MRPSERVAAAAVVLMMAPGLFAFPVLGIWYLAKVWPDLSAVDRILVLCALATVFGTSLHGWRRAIRQHGQGGPFEMSPLENFLLWASVQVGGWALVHRLDLLLFGLAWGSGYLCWDCRRQRAAPPGRATSS